MSAAIVIVTKDRRAEVERAVRSAVAQDGVAEVVVLDDGSRDGTPEALADAFRDVRLVPCRESRGYIVRRNEGAAIASGSVIVSIDDDAEFASTDTVARLLRAFEDDRVAAVALPHVDLLQGERVLQEAPDAEHVYVTHCFRGTAYAVRREVFLRLGGFRESLFHQAEEQDLCLRLLAQGGLVALVPATPIIHHASSKRDPLRAWTFGPRNDILFAWHNVPMPELLTRVLRVTALQLSLGVRVRRPVLFARSLAAGYAHALRRRGCRRPVSRSTYRLYRELEVSGPVRLDDLPARYAAAGGRARP